MYRLPQLKSNVFQTSCISRLVVDDYERLLATSAFIFGQMRAVAPMPKHWLGLENFLVQYLLAKHHLIN